MKSFMIILIFSRKHHDSGLKVLMLLLSEILLIRTNCLFRRYHLSNEISLSQNLLCKLHFYLTWNFETSPEFMLHSWIVLKISQSINWFENKLPETFDSSINAFSYFPNLHFDDAESQCCQINTNCFHKHEKLT